MEALGDIEIKIEGAAEEHKFTPDPVYSESYLDDQMRKAEPAWESVPDPEAWLEELRGGTVHSQDVIEPSSHGH